MEPMMRDPQAVIEQLVALPLHEAAPQLAQLVSNLANASVSTRVLVQGSLFQRLQQALDPTRPTQPAAVLVVAGNGDANPAQPHNTSSASRLAEASDADSQAQAWQAAKAFEQIYSFGDEEVVLSVISFWSSISGFLSGSWLQQASHADTGSQDGGCMPASSAAQQAKSSSSSAAAAGVADGTVPSPEMQYLSWLWRLGPATVAVVLQQMHSFWRLTGINHLQQQQHTATPAHALSLLLLFLELHAPYADSHAEGSSSGSGGTTSNSWCLKGCEPAVQLLQLLHGGAASTPASVPAAMAAGEAFAGVCCILQAAAALHITQPGSAAATAPAHQLAARAGHFLRAWYGWCSYGEAAHLSAAESAAAAEAARHAAASMGSSSSGGSAAGLARPGGVESLYDCYMMLLLQQMLQGPRSASSKAAWAAGSSPAGQPGGSHLAGSNNSRADATGRAGALMLNEEEWEAWLDSDSFKPLAALIATYERPAALVRGLHTLVQQQLMAAENAAASAAATAGAAAAGGGSGAEAAEGRPGTQGQPSAKGTAAKKADKAAMGRVMLLLEKVFLWQQQQAQAATCSSSRGQAAAAAAQGVRQLLLGLSELLRPAANCSVEWRAAALTAMLMAVEDAQRQYPGQDLEPHMWCDASVEGLLFCASHDPSIQARRAAVQLLQHVVLPNHSSTAQALVRCLADKLSDKDSGVAAAALQLFVQIEPKVVCNCLSAAQWCTAVQAGLELVYGPGMQPGAGSSKGSRQQGVSAGAETRQHFLQLLKRVLASPASPSQQQCGWQWLAAQGSRSVGLEGCRQVLLQLVLESVLADRWQTLLRGS